MQCKQQHLYLLLLGRTTIVNRHKRGRNSTNAVYSSHSQDDARCILRWTQCDVAAVKCRRRKACVRSRQWNFNEKKSKSHIWSHLTLLALNQRKCRVETPSLLKPIHTLTFTLPFHNIKMLISSWFQEENDYQIKLSGILPGAASEFNCDHKFISRYNKATASLINLWCWWPFQCDWRLAQSLYNLRLIYESTTIFWIGYNWPAEINKCNISLFFFFADVPEQHQFLLNSNSEISSSGEGLPVFGKSPRLIEGTVGQTVIMSCIVFNLAAKRVRRFISYPSS